MNLRQITNTLIARVCKDTPIVESVERLLSYATGFRLHDKMQPEYTWMKDATDNTVLSYNFSTKSPEKHN